MNNVKRQQEIIMSKKLIAAQRGYQPVVGDDQDIAIRESMVRLGKLLLKVDNKLLRELEGNGDPDHKMTPKMKDILFHERSIINRMEQRKFDF